MSAVQAARSDVSTPVVSTTPPSVSGGAGGITRPTSAVAGKAPVRSSTPGAEPVVRSTATAVQFPAVGTPAALASPSCDATRKRVRFPDIYGPPCVAPWPAGTDNGGHTSAGVDRESVKIVAYIPSDATNVDAVKETYTNYVAGFNRVFEFWGRKLQISFYQATGSDEVAQRADAIKVAAMKPFITFTGAGAPLVYGSEMAARGVIVYGAFPPPWKDTQSQAPFRWGYAADDRTTVSPALEYVGKRLTGRPARWAGDATMHPATRTFGLVYPDTWERSFIDSETARHHVQFASIDTYEEGDTAGAQERARTVIARMKAAGVTTVVDAASLVFNIALTREATVQLYSPEWVITGYSFQDVVLLSRTYDQQQWAHAFGVGSISVFMPVEKLAYYTDYEWLVGRPPPDTVIASYVWPATLWAASGVMLAGPSLTPRTFRDGVFAIPSSGGSYCNCRATVGVSYGRSLGAPWDDYTGYDDITEKWWDPTYRTKDELGLDGIGAYMKVDGGRRYQVGAQPTSEPHVFDPNGAVEKFEEFPPGEAPPQYPPPPR